MKTDWSEEDIRKAVEKVKEKAAGDPKFRQLALSNPTAAIKDVTTWDVPSEMKIEMIENPKGTAGLQASVDIQPGPELSDDQLGKVAGGMRCAAISGRCPCGRTAVMWI